MIDKKNSENSSTPLSFNRVRVRVRVIHDLHR